MSNVKTPDAVWRITMAVLVGLTGLLSILASSLLPPSSPEEFVVVPTADNTSPMAGMDVYDPRPISINQAAQSITIIAVSDVVSVIASARDDDGGIKSVKMWATYTYYKPGQISGPGLVTTPVSESVSNATVGESTLKSRIVATNFDLKKELGGWSKVKVDVWIEGENFYGGKVKTPIVSLKYPTRQDGDTDYMAFCRKSRVPIPPDWALSGTAWVLQGNLGDPSGTNLLQPPGPNSRPDAFVWTYSDPVRRGACIALPRGVAGQRGGIAGIICQSAETGHACFWDSRQRDNNNPLREMPLLDWRTQILRISELKDASNLTEPGSGTCPECHRGNNVFLIAPEDPTWKKVLTGLGFAGGNHTNQGGTFTTRVEASSDMNGGHPRYIPVTYPSMRPDWANIFQVGGCAGKCHEKGEDFTSRDGGIPRAPLMLPACAQREEEVENCYK